MSRVGFRTHHTAKSEQKINAFLGRRERCKGINRSKKATLGFPSSLNDIPEEQQIWMDTADNNFTTVRADLLDTRVVLASEIAPSS